MALAVGDLVVVPSEPTLGVGRVESFVTGDDGVPGARVLLYSRPAFVVRPLDAVIPCPPGVWPPVTT